MSTLQELCYRKIVAHVNAYDIESLPLPPSMKCYLKSFSSTVQSNASFANQLEELKRREKSKRRKSFVSFLRRSKAASQHSPALNAATVPAAAPAIPNCDSTSKHNGDNSAVVDTPPSSDDHRDRHKNSRKKRLFPLFSLIGVNNRQKSNGSSKHSCTIS